MLIYVLGFANIPKVIRELPKMVVGGSVHSIAPIKQGFLNENSEIKKK